jgi:hypothetical protein
MEVVVLLVAIVGAVLLAVPRLQRRKASSGPRPARRPKVAAAAAPASAVASWAPPAESDDAWEDDLGWEGAAEPTPEARTAWEDWRATSLAPDDSPEPVAADPEVRAELPSVERWRAEAVSQEQAGDTEDEWVEDDDDGLGWMGEDEPPAARPLWNGDAGSADTADFRDWSRGGEPATVESQGASAFATASATDVAAAAQSEPELGRTVALDEESWDPPITRTWGAGADRPVANAAPAVPRPRGRRRVHPVVLVAAYAAVGIGLVVLVSTVLFGGSEKQPQPARATATATASAAPTAAATVVERAKATATPQPTATPDPAIAAAAQTDFRKERRTAERAHKSALAAAVAARKRAVHKADAERKRQAKVRSNQASTGGGTGATASPQTSSTPNYEPTNPRPAATPKPHPACEFCIG